MMGMTVTFIIVLNSTSPHFDISKHKENKERGASEDGLSLILSNNYLHVASMR